MEARAYQAEGIQQINGAWESGAQNVLYTLPTGGGKTFVFSKILEAHSGAAVAIAHRQELVGQMALSLAALGIPHAIHAPRPVVKLIIRLEQERFGRSFYDPNSPVSVAGVGTLLSRRGALQHWASQVTLWIQDECFPPGTLVDGRPIESIRVGDVVTAYDEKTGTFHPRRVLRCFKNSAPEYMVRIALGTHHVIRCTRWHPFWTRRGWVAAADLTICDEVLADGHASHLRSMPDSIRAERAPTLPTEKNGSGVLPEGVRVEVSDCARKEAKGGKTPGGTLHNLQGLGGPVRPSVGAVETDRTGVLQPELLERISTSDLVPYDGEHQPRARIGTDAHEQPNAQQEIPAENVGDAAGHGPPTKGARGKRAATDGSGGEARPAVFNSWVYAADDCEDRPEGGPDGVSSALQDRLRKGLLEDCNRGRREQPSDVIGARTGCEKEQVFNWRRVESVSILQCGDTRYSSDGHVYNIEVDEFHTYVAEGIVVHNCHHVLRANQWGKAVDMFPNARGLGVTATPGRADGKGLGRVADGVFDSLIQGPGMRELINAGYLCDYRILAPKCDLDLDNVPLSKTTGDFSETRLRAEVKDKRALLVGHVVEHYLKHARGKLGITFVTDVETAHSTAAEFLRAGVPAAAISAKTGERERHELIRRYRNRELLQLVNVDLFGEGFDLPAIEVVSMARPTHSFNYFAQMFGRCLRLMDGKLIALIIDHVDNVRRHNGPPDQPRIWTLDRRDSRAKGARDPDEIPYRVCADCTEPYPMTLKVCPACGYIYAPERRDGPEFVEGDLIELDAATIAAMRKDVAAVNEPPAELQIRMRIAGAPERAIGGAMKHRRQKQDAQASLRRLLGLYGGRARAAGTSDSESYRRFYFRYGVDIMSAQALSRRDAHGLTCKILDDLGRGAI